MGAITISVALQKGGTAKTSTAQNLAAILGNKGYKTLLIDVDGQANTTQASGVYQADITLSDVFAGNKSVKDVILPLALYYDLVPADKRLYNLDSANIPADILHMALDDVRKKYDYIILDTPPSLGNLLKNSLFASDYVVVPCDPRPFALRGINDLQATLTAVQQATARAKVIGLLLVRFNPRTVLARNMMSVLLDMAKGLDTELFNTTIRESIAVGEAQAEGEPLIQYAPSAAVTKDYILFTEELLHRMGV